MIDLYSSWLLRALLQSTLHAVSTFAVAYLIDRMLQHRAPYLRSWLWRVFYVKVALVGMVQLLWTYPSVDSSMDKLASTSINESEFVAYAPDPFSMLQLQTELIPLDTTQLASSLTGSIAQNSSETSWQTLLIAYWCAGVCFCVFRLIRQWHQATTIKRKTKKLTSTACQPFFDSLASLTGRKNKPQIRITSEDGSPYLVGLLRPFIVVPGRWLHASSNSSNANNPVRMILAHELAHIHRRDLVWNLFVSIVHVTLYFHPILWLTRKRYHAAQEAACDALAIQKAKLNPAQYAELLIQVSGRGSIAYASPTIVPLIVCKPRKILFERLRAMQTSTLTSSLPWPHQVAIVMGFVLAVLPWSIGNDQSVLAQEITLEDSSKSTSAKKPTKAKSTMKSSSSSASASASGFGVMSGSSSGSAGGSGFSFKSNVQASATAGSSGDEGAKESKNRPTSTSSLPAKARSSSSRSTSMSLSREVNEHGETIKVTVQEPARQILLSQSSETGIDVRIIPTRKSSSAKEVHVTAEDAAHLKKKDSKAYAVYRKYMEPQLKGEGSTVTSIAVQGGGNLNDAEGNPAQQMMRKQLEEMLKNETLDPAIRGQIEGLINNLPEQN
jgi:beta-lactamase regulating signal transducer with metallopeptidase domain